VDTVPADNVSGSDRETLMSTEQMSFDDLCVVFNYEPKRRLLTNAEAAEVLRTTPGALDFKRFHGGGPRYFKPADARRVLYSERDVLFYLWEGMRTSTSEKPAQRAAV
jgi:hypothetical protein